MTVTASDILSTAEKNFLTASAEADHRCCITRAYYSAYHAGIYYQTYVISRPGKMLPLGNGGDHANLINQMEKPNVLETDPEFSISQELAGYLRRLKRDRFKADYKLSENVEAIDTENCIALAKLFFSQIYRS